MPRVCGLEGGTDYVVASFVPGLNITQGSLYLSLEPRVQVIDGSFVCLSAFPVLRVAVREVSKHFIPQPARVGWQRVTGPDRNLLRGQTEQLCSANLEKLCGRLNKILLQSTAADAARAQA